MASLLGVTFPFSDSLQSRERGSGASPKMGIYGPALSEGFSPNTQLALCLSCLGRFAELAISSPKRPSRTKSSPLFPFLPYLNSPVHPRQSIPRPPCLTPNSLSPTRPSSSPMMASRSPYVIYLDPLVLYPPMDFRHCATGREMERGKGTEATDRKGK